jgi:DNA-binding NarL/FixJ family response regulator
MSTKRTIRILLVDDHAVVREGLRTLLEQHDDLTVAGEASNGAVALLEASRLRPDLVLLDMKMPGMSGIETITALRKLLPTILVLIFTGYSDESQMHDVLRAGATGYMLKDAQREDIARAVRAVADGQVWLHPKAQRQLLDWVRRPPSPMEQLTRRERDVLLLLTNGLSNKQISRQLVLSEGTIKGYVSQVLEKLGVVDRTQAALLAQKAGFTE